MGLLEVLIRLTSLLFTGWNCGRLGLELWQSLLTNYLTTRLSTGTSPNTCSANW